MARSTELQNYRAAEAEQVWPQSPSPSLSSVLSAIAFLDALASANAAATAEALAKEDHSHS